MNRKMEFTSLEVLESSDKNVKKIIFERKAPPAVAETVLYRHGDYRERTVVCLSVMSGCPVGCSFCGTGKFFARNLSYREITEQAEVAVAATGVPPGEIKRLQLMFMAMGEPFLNYGDTQVAIERLHESYPNAELLVSTSAPPAAAKHIGMFSLLSKKIEKTGLQFSVHASTDEGRKRIIPTPTCTLEQIAAMGAMWHSFTGRKPVYNYCVQDWNSNMKDAANLIKLFNPEVWNTTLSVVCETDRMAGGSTEKQLETIDLFAHRLKSRGANVKVFNPAGQDDIGGGCGQLWRFHQWARSRNLLNESILNDIADRPRGGGCYQHRGVEK